MRAGFWRLAGWTVVGFLAGVAPAAAASQAQLSYIGYLAGAPVLSLEASITVPEAARAARARRNAAYGSTFMRKPATAMNAQNANALARITLTA